jgi:hypothetical protein
VESKTRAFQEISQPIIIPHFVNGVLQQECLLLFQRMAIAKRQWPCAEKHKAGLQTSMSSKIGCSIYENAPV